MNLNDHMETLSKLTDEELLQMLKILRQQKVQHKKTPERKIKAKKKKDLLLQQFRSLSPEERTKIIKTIEPKK